MSWSLVGSLGTATQGASGAAVTPAYGQSPTAGNLLVLWVSGDSATAGDDTLPAAPSGWTVAHQKAAAGRVTSSIFIKKAAGGDAAPTVALLTGTLIAAQLGEFHWSVSGVSFATDQVADAIGTTGTSLTATAGGTDSASGELILASASTSKATAATSTIAHVFNNGATTNQAGNNNTATSANHYNFAYGITTGNSGADTDTCATPGTNRDLSLAMVSIKAFAPTTTSVAEVKLESPPDGTPITQTNHVIVAHARTASAATATVLNVALYQGATEITSATLTTAPLTTTFTEYDLSVLDADAGTITDYTNLRIRVWGTSGTGETSTVEVSQLKLQTPVGGGGGSATAGDTITVSSSASASGVHVGTAWIERQVNSTKATSTAGTTGVSLAFGSSVTAGDVIVVTGDYENSITTGAATITDTSGNVTTWTTHTDQNGISISVSPTIGWGIATTTGPCTPKITFANASTGGIQLFIGDFTPPNGVVAEDGTFATNLSTGTTATTPAGTGSGTQDLVVNHVAFALTPTSVNSPWTPIGALQLHDQGAYLINAPGNSTPNQTQSGSGAYLSTTLALRAIATGADSITISSTASASTTHIGSATAGDTVTLSSAATTNQGHQTTASDSISTSSIASANSARQTTATDTITVSSIASSSTSTNASASDSISTSSAAIGNLVGHGVTAQTVSVSSSAAALGDQGSAADSISISSAANANTARLATASQAITVSSTATARGSGTTTSVAEVELQAPPHGTPATRTNHKIVAHARTAATATNTRLNAALYQGAAEITSTTLSTTALTTTFTEYDLSVLDADAATITDYTNLRIRFWGTSTTSDTSTVEVSQLKLQMPLGSGGSTTAASTIALSSLATATGTNSRASTASSTIAIASIAVPTHTGHATAADSFTVSDQSGGTRGGNAFLVNAGDTITITSAAASRSGNALSVITVSSAATGVAHSGAVTAATTIATSSAASANQGRHATTSDNITIASAASGGVTGAASAASTITTSSSALGNISGHLTASDIISLSSLASALQARNAIAAETISVLSAATQSHSLNVTASELISLSDSAIGGDSGNGFANESLSINSTAFGNLSGHGSAVEPIIEVTSTAFGGTQRQGFASDSFDVSSFAEAIIIGHGSASDLIIINDQAIGNVSGFTLAGDTLTMASAAVPGGKFNTSASQTILLSSHATVPVTAQPQFFLLF